MLKWTGLLCFALSVSVAAAMSADRDRERDPAHSEQEGSSEGDERKPEERSEPIWGRKTKHAEATSLPFLKLHQTFEETTTEPPRQPHPNERFFPLIYSQVHVDTMFKSGSNWYTWSTEKRTDGSTAVNYYICYDEPEKCDEVGWERTDSPPKCAFDIEMLVAGDRACISSFGAEPRTTNACDGAEQMKVSDMTDACGARIQSTWRFVRTHRRRTAAGSTSAPTAAPAPPAPPADVNALLCDGQDECVVNVEYRIHRDRISFSLREQTKGRTFKSVLTREAPIASRKATASAPDNRIQRTHHAGKGDGTRKFLHHHEKLKEPEPRRTAAYTSTVRRKGSRPPADDVSDDISE